VCEEGNKIKNIQGNRTPDYDICTRNKDRNIKTRQLLEANEMKVQRKIVGKTKIVRIRNQKNQRILQYPTC
jgi:hypothetical protein